MEIPIVTGLNSIGSETSSARNFLTHLLARSASILARYASDGLLIEVVSCNHVCNQRQSH
jgi:hypothetical protein